ncbi:peptidoglycan-binding protein [Aquibium carbonis]|uniref:Peptidoglycan-binding protein n=1 Tax=Aquibium carbonis TaxID=2495581 RepID=A0A3S0A885_9HYPH|nr:peptidoglycan-binding protein [Aquibium carbonis]RST86910.1 peptidoglycan-binding protein [Aquibium carbonis]
MSNNRSFLDTLNAGRQRRTHASLDDLNRTLEDLENRFGSMQQGRAGPDGADRRARRLADTVPAREPRADRVLTSPPPERRSAEASTLARKADDNAAAIGSLRREIERSRQQAAGVGSLSGLSEELKALREDMRLHMSTGMRQEFDALRDDLGRTAVQPQTAAEGRELAAEMERLSSAINSMASRSDDRGLEMLRSEMEQVRATLAELAREDTVRSIDDRWSQFEKRAGIRNVPDPAIHALTQRLEQIGEAIGNLPDSRALRSLDEKVRTLATAVDHFSHQSTTPVHSFETIEQRLDEISRAIVASTVSGRSMPAEPFERIEARISALAQQIDDMSSEGVAGELLDRMSGLSQRVEDIAIQAALPEKAIERLGRQIGIIYDRLENESSGAERERILDSLERRFAEIAALFEERQERATVQGQALMRDLDRRLEEMADRFQAGGGGLDVALLHALDEKFADLSNRIDSARGERTDARLLDAFESRLESIASRLDESVRRAGDPDPILLQALDERFADLSDRIDGRADAGNVSALRALEERLETIAARMEDTSRQVADIDPHLILGLEKQLAGLTAHLSRPNANAAELEDIAPRLDSIERSLFDQRDAIVAAAQDAAQRAVVSLRASGIDDEDAGALAEELRTLETLARKSDERNSRTFEAIHDTLLKVVDRLASLEIRNADIATAYRSRIDADAVPSLAPHSDEMPLAMSSAALSASTTLSGVASAIAPALRQQPPHVAAKAAAQAAAASSGEADQPASPKKSLLGGFARAFSGRKEAKADPTTQQEPTLPGMPEPRLDDPLESAVIDQPLEPGSGAPDLNAIMRRVRDERGTAAPSTPDAGATGKADFIAAARRAAQAAAAEAQSFRQSDGPDGGKRKFSASEFLRAKRKPILMAAAAIMMALAGLQLGKAFFNDAVQLADKSAAPVASDASFVASAPPADLSLQSDQPDASETRTIRAVDKPAQPIAEASAVAAPLPAMPEPDDVAMDETGSGDFEATEVESGDDSGELASLGFEAAPIEAGPIALREAADAGDPRAIFEIGNRYDAGRGVTADRAIAATWYERAAEQGFAPAQYRIGNFYEKGIGVARDVSKAKTWYQLAAAQGNASAMHNLAVLFAMGTDGAVDNDSAARWFVKAAELGVKDSQYNLGILSAKGLGVPQSLEESYKWFALLAKDGDKDAAAKRDEVANALRPEQLARARAATELWKPKPLAEDANVVDIPDPWQESQGTTASIDMTKAVMTIQLILNKNGYDAGSADGVMGSRTKSAIMAFQRDNGLAPTGEVNDELVRILLAKK